MTVSSSARRGAMNALSAFTFSLMAVMPVSLMGGLLRGQRDAVAEAESASGLGMRMRIRPVSLVMCNRASGATGPGSRRRELKCCEEDAWGVRVSWCEET
jgi:hypothetical protein